jgi:uncharacterized protein
MKRLFIIHGWLDSPAQPWLVWVKNEMEKHGFIVEIPAMPHPDNPTIEDWVNHLEKVVGQPDQGTYFVGHSVGCQTILRYLEQAGQLIGGVVFVAGWFKLLPGAIENEEDAQTAAAWLNTPIDFEKLKTLIPKSVAIFSDNDYYVPLENAEIFEQKLGTKTTIQHNKGHYYKDDGVIEMPLVVEELKIMF